MYTIKCNLANIFLVLPLGTIGGSADIATSGSTFIAPWAGFGKIGPQGPLPLAQSAVRSMDITARAT